MTQVQLWGPITADTTPETVFTNLVNTVTVLETITISNPDTGLATTIILSLGADGATTRVVQYPIPAGAGTYTFAPLLRITGTQILQLSSTVTDDIAVTTGNGYREAA